MNKQFKTTGIILRKVNLNEADRILTLLTTDMGKIHCIAKGARRITSKFCGRLELFNQVEITCYRGRNLENIREVTLIDAQPLFDLSLSQHSALFYIAEITHRLIQDGQQVEGAYALLTDTLKHLTDDNTETIVHTYLIKLMTLLGFMSPWHECAVSGERLDLNAPIYMSSDFGSLVSNGYSKPGDARMPIPIIKWVSFMQNYPFAAAVKVTTTEGERKQVWLVLKSILKNILTKPLKSEMFLHLN